MVWYGPAHLRPGGLYDEMKAQGGPLPKGSTKKERLLPPYFRIATPEESIAFEESYRQQATARSKRGMYSTKKGSISPRGRRILSIFNIINMMRVI